MLVICGKNTHSAKGVDIEHKIARPLSKQVRYRCGRVDAASFPLDVAAADQSLVEISPVELARATGLSKR